MVKLTNVCTMTGGRETQERQIALKAKIMEERKKSRMDYVQGQRNKWVEEGIQHERRRRESDRPPQQQAWQDAAGQGVQQQQQQQQQQWAAWTEQQQREWAAQQ